MSYFQKKVLFLRFSSLGDVIIANFRAMKVKDKHPDWHVTWLVDSAYADLVRSQPWIDDVIGWNRRRDGNVGFLKVLKEVRRRRFDILLDMHSSDRSSLFSLLSGIPLRYSGRKRFLFTHNCYSFDGVWDKEQRLCSCSRYLYPPQTSERIRGLLKTQMEVPALAIPIGASYVKKRWPVKNWIDFCTIAAKAGYKLYLLGDGSDEIKSSNEISAAVKSDNIINLVGKLSIFELVQVVNEADVTISGDTGTLHIARALGKPVVAMFGPSYIADKPYVESFKNVFYCSCPQQGCLNFGCEKPCMETISPDAVIKNVNNIFLNKNDKAAENALNCKRGKKW